MSDRVVKPELKVLRNELDLIASKWYDIGLQLDFKKGELDNIKADHAHVGVKALLLELLKQWLKRVDPPPSWKALIDALRTPAVKEMVIAGELAEKYCPTGIVQ